MQLATLPLRPKENWRITVLTFNFSHKSCSNVPSIQSTYLCVYTRSLHFVYCLKLTIFQCRCVCNFTLLHLSPNLKDKEIKQQSTHERLSSHLKQTKILKQMRHNHKVQPQNLEIEDKKIQKSKLSSNFNNFNTVLNICRYTSNEIS